MLISCLGVALDLALLAHFLRHYASLGIAPERMHLILHADGETTPRLREAERILEEFGAARPKRWIAAYTSEAMWAERRALQREIAAATDWIVNADIDEHYVFPAPLDEIVAHCVEVGVNAVQGVQIDRFAPGGELVPVSAAPELSRQFPIEGEASFHIFGAGEHRGISATTKLMLHRADIMPRRGGHNPEGLTSGSAQAATGQVPRFLAGRPLHTMKQLADPAFRFAFAFQSAHFKWSATRLRAVEARLSTPGVSRAGREFGGKVRAYLGEHRCIRLEDAALRRPDQRPGSDWRQQMASLRAQTPARPPAQAAAGGEAAGAPRIAEDVFVVIRAAGERTEAVTHALAAHELSPSRIAVLHEVPFATAIRKAFERGVAEAAEWTLCLDADVLLRPGAIADLLVEARRQDAAAFGVSGTVADVLLGQWRVAGQHLYRTALLGKALEKAKFDPAKRRPESHVKRYMREAGHPWIQSSVMMGLHDAEQFYADIFRKVVVHSRKHERFMAYARLFWARAGKADPDFRVALASLDGPERIGAVPERGRSVADSVLIDRTQFPDRIDAYLSETGLVEKDPLTPDAIAPHEVEARLAAFKPAPEWVAARPAIEADRGPHKRLDRGVHSAPPEPTHAVPVFCGRQSRSHQRVPVGSLRAAAAAELAAGIRSADVSTFVQFAGFPRSGHSILGSILDAHSDAIVSHELDVMGLIRAEVPMPEIFALIGANSRDFQAAGRYWNGFSYAVPAGQGGRSDRPRVLGDKKADWAVRHVMADPSLLDQLEARLDGRRSVWIAVIRNPWDNVATLSLRKGRRYDELRIEVGEHAAFADRLRAEQGTRIAAEALPDVLADYCGLCAGLAAMKARIASRDWLELRQDDLIADPAGALRRILAFLNLHDADGFSDRAASIVSRSPSRTRDQVAWPDALRRDMGELIAQHDFLAGFDGLATEAASVPAGRAGRRTDAVRLVSCVGVDGAGGGDLALLGHFLDHYAALGIAPSRTHLILNASDTGSAGLARARTMIEARGLAEAEIWIGPYTSAAMWERRRALQTRVCGPHDWIVNADVDEFHAYPAPLSEVVAYCEERDVACVQGPFVDRIAADGTLPVVAPDRSLWEQFPLSADVGSAIGKRPGADDANGTVKVMLHRADALPGLGGHNLQKGAPEKYVYGLPLMHFAQIKSPSWRFALPFRVLHVKWTAGLAARLEARRSTVGASSAGSLYGGRILDYFNRNDGRIVLDDVCLAPDDVGNADGQWKDRVAQLAATAAKLRPVRARVGRVRAARQAMRQSLAKGWSVRQLTVGSGAGIYHSHSYYDIPVLSEDAQKIASYRMSIEGRWMGADDTVEIGVVDADRGGFMPVGTSRAWSWQQGPMVQWLPGGRRLVWNDRVRDPAQMDAEGADFVAHLHDVETGVTSTLDRTVYALTPSGNAALSVNMARLDRARPGYGYTGGRGAALEIGAPDDDGVWRLDLTQGASDPARLILPLSRAVAFLAEHLEEPERSQHLSGGLVHWFNHVKIAPGGKRFTVKLRWRDGDLKGPWTGLMSVSLTCGLDGSDLALLARGASHVMWLDDEQLYFWHQAEKAFATMRDAVPTGTDRTEPFNELITANVHFRHIPGAPRWAIYDTPYAEEIDVMRLDRATGHAERLVRFTGHKPRHGPFRCDLHPVPSHDGGRIVVTSLQDGGRQIYLIERTEDG